MSPQAKTRQPIPRSVQDANLPQIMIDTKFNQGYTVASSVNGGGEAVAVRNGKGEVALFTQGTDGTIWNFYPDPNSDTGYNGVSTTLKGSTFSAAIDQQGNILVFAALGLQLSYIRETPGGSSRWSKPAVLSLPKATGAVAISSILVQVIANALYIAVLTESQGTSITYAVAFSVWTQGPELFQLAKVHYSSTNCCWAGNSSSTAAIVCADVNLSTYNISTGVPSKYNMAATFSSIGISSVQDANNQTQFFTILADGNVNQLVSGNNGQSYYWSPLSQGMTFRQVVASLDGNNNLNILAVSGNNQLYNWVPVSGSQSGFSYPPASIATGVALLGVAVNDAGALDAFTIGSTGSSLNHLFFENESTNWAIQPVQVPTNGSLEQFISYSTDITAYDATGVPLVNAPVTIYASEAASLSVNGLVYFVSAHRPIRTSTNAAGMLSISQQTATLAIPTLEINYTNQMPASSMITIDPSATSNVQERLATVTGADLMDARDQDGSYMIGSDYRTTENTDSMASALNSTLTAVGAVRASASAYPMMRHGARKGIWVRHDGTLEDTTRLTGTPPSWQLSFEGNRVIYKELTREAVQAVLASQAHLPNANGIFDWLGDIGDFLGGVIDGVINVVNIVVDAVGSVVNAVITFIVDGVTYLFNTVLTIVQQALDLAQTIFAAVKVFLEKVWEWIGFLFAWNDILRTQQAISYSVNQFLGFVTGSLTGIQGIVDSKFAGFQSQLTRIFNDAVNNIAGSYSIGGYVDSNEPQSPQFEQAMSNNIVYSGIINNPTSTASMTSALLITADDPIYNLLQELLQMGISAEASAAFSQALAYFDNLGGSPDQIFRCGLAGLISAIEGVVLSVVSGAQNIVDTLLLLGQALVQVLQDSINEKWNIPIISQLYRWLTDSDLTTLDLIALAMAIPTTFTYKIIYNKAPFPDGASLTAFENSFNSQSMLAAAGFGPAAADAKMVASDALVSKEIATLFATFGAVGTTLGGWVTAVNDAFPLEAPPFLSKVIWVLNCGAQVCAFPWWVSNTAPSCNTDNNEACLNMAWIMGNIGLLMDAVFIKIEKRIPESTGDAGITVQLIYAGLCHLPMSVIASVGANGTVIAANILPLVPELCKLLKYSAVVEATYSISPFVCAAIDALAYTAAGIVGFVAATSGADVAAADAQPVLAI